MEKVKATMGGVVASAAVIMGGYLVERSQQESLMEATGICAEFQNDESTELCISNAEETFSTDMGEIIQIAGGLGLVFSGYLSYKVIKEMADTTGLYEDVV